MFTVYILYSPSSEKFYIGYTSELPEDRLKKHLSNHTGYTARYKDWIISYSEKFTNKEEAIKREREIKGWKSKDKIRKLISSAE
jgi:putative endonuclease